MRHRNLMFGVSASALLLASPSLAHAQTSSQRPDRATVLEEVIVTAERVETSLQRTAVSVAAFNTETLKQQSVTDMTDLTRAVPGMRFQGQGNIATGDVTVRGVNRAPIGTGGPVVVNYFNDVPLADAIYLPTFDIGSLQVLRGPQGTLFGRNTVGGAILLYSTPVKYDFEGYATANYGRFDYWQLEGAVNVPIAEDVAALRLAGQIRRRDGYVENIGFGPDFNDIHTDSFRGALLLEPFEGLRNTTVVDYLRGREVGWASIAYEFNPGSFFNLILPGAPASVAQALALGHFKTNSNVPDPHFSRDLLGVFNTTTYEITPNVTLKNIFGYRTVEQAFSINNDGLGVAAFEIGTLLDRKYLSEEIQLVGNALDDRLEWIYGAFYSKIKPTGPDGTTNIFGVLTNAQYLTNQSYAVFGNLKYRLTPELAVSGGYRYTWDIQRNCSSNSNITVEVCETLSANPATPPGTKAATIRASAPSWRASIEYQPTENLFLYALVSRAYRFGGISNIFAPNEPCVTGAPLGTYTFGTATVTCSRDVGLAAGGAPTGRAIDLRPFQNLKNETLTNYEAGLRADTNLGGWPQRLNLTVYHYIYENLIGSLTLIGLIQPGTPGAPLFDTVGFNAGEVTATGVEADLTLRPIPSLTLGLNLAYTDQEQTDAGSGPANFPVSIPPATLAAPKWAYNLSARYVLPFKPLDGELSVNASYFHTGDWQTQQVVVPGYELGNLRVDWSNIGGRGIGAAFWMTNVFNEDYLQSPVTLGSILPSKVANFGDPRLWGVELSYRW